MTKTQYLKDYSLCGIDADLLTFLEKRQDVGGGSDPIYIGYNRQPNAATTAATWLIFKLTYSGTTVIRYQLPDNGVEFKYVWDDRATYFS